jgi:hypothetical protein
VTVTVTRTVYVPVAGATAVLKVPVESAVRLPPGGEYAERSGRARVSISHENGAIVARAECDSLERQVREYERIMQGRGTVETVVKKEETEETFSGGFKKGFKWFLTGVAMGAAGCFLVIRRKG